MTTDFNIRVNMFNREKPSSKITDRKFNFSFERTKYVYNLNFCNTQEI